MQQLGERARAAAAAALGENITTHDATVVDGGRGVFSNVVRVRLAGEPSSVAVKLVRQDANGAASMTNGAVDRERIAYQTVLPRTPNVGAPVCHGISTDDRDTPAFVLEDLSAHRPADQIAGLADRDLRAIVVELVELHVAWANAPELDTIQVRRSTPAHLPAEALARGVEVLHDRWPHIDRSRRDALESLASRRAAAVSAFINEDAATLCHGDPRADNVVFDPTGRAVLFDWQQLAVQFGEADLSWLLATSIDRDLRRGIEGDIVASYAMARRQDAATTWRRYVVGMTLPGLAVLLLAQRVADDERTSLLITKSIERIADAVIDLRLVELVDSLEAS